MFGMSSVYASRIGLTIFEITILLSTLYFGAVLFIGPIASLSDRMDRRQLIVVLGLGATAACLLAIVASGVILFNIAGIPIYAIYVIALLVGGLANPLYSLLIAHTNDHLEADQMASASAGMVFLNGVGASLGPIITGYAMTVFGDSAFWGFQGLCLVAIAAYALWRMTQRGAVDVSETSPYAVVAPRATAIAAEIATEYAIEQAQAETESEAEAQLDPEEATSAGDDRDGAAPSSKGMTVTPVRNGADDDDRSR